MTLATGSRLGSYEILSALGAGGMGEVYRARDTKLGRDVALKILPSEFTHDPDRVARFQREAKLLASLNDHHIAAIHGLEEIGDQHALVMELVEGEDLSHRIARGAIPFEEALPIARQIAEALEVAHDQGIIHRDLKPANIKVRDDGAMKVLDFGLAKLTQLNSGAAVAGELSHSPTLTAHGTMQGLILGTAAYMSPEQARGRVVDKRTDVWAFGAVLYEMLSGVRAFEGEDATETIAAVVKSTPNWTALPADVPPHIVTLIRRCLDKDRKTRVGDIAVARFLLDGHSADDPGAAHKGQTSPPQSTWRGMMLPWALTAMSIAALGAVLLVLAPWQTAPTRVAKVTLLPPAGEALATDSSGPDVAISRDGTTVVFSTGTRSNKRWYVRPLASLTPTRLDGLPANVHMPFFSPDGLWIAFFQESAPGAQTRRLIKVLVSGGAATAICTLPDGDVGGGTWGLDDTIVFGTTKAQGGGLWRVPARGGTPDQLTVSEQGGHLWPQFLPGEQAVVFTIQQAGRSSLDAKNAQVAVLNLTTKAQTVVAAGSLPKYSNTGHLVYAAGGALLSMGFDPGHLSATTSPAPVVDGVLVKPTGAADFDLSADGTLVYVSGSSAGALRSLFWFDRQGHEEPIGMTPGPYIYARLSPDNTSVALDHGDGQEISIYSLNRTSMDVLTAADRGPNRLPVWSHNSSRLAFTSTRDGVESIYWQLADGSRPAERLSPASAASAGPMSFTPDDGALLFQSPLDAEPRRLALLRLGDHQEESLMVDGLKGRNGVISPDGRWIAYESAETGRAQVYLRPFPKAEANRQIVSTAGGTRPLWSPKGDELFYFVEPGTIMSVRTTGAATAAGLPLSAPAVAARGDFAIPNAGGRHYDVSRDGQRFLLLKEAGSTERTPSYISAVLNWSEELKAKVPVP